MKDAHSAAREEYLRTHIEECYGLRVSDLHRLDRGVFSATLVEGGHWVVRVFPPERPAEQVEADAKILQLLERSQFPAERCAAAAPVSFLRDRGILVTHYVEGTGAD